MGLIEYFKVNKPTIKTLMRLVRYAYILNELTIKKRLGIFNIINKQMTIQNYRDYSDIVMKRDLHYRTKKNVFYIIGFGFLSKQY